MSWKEQMPGCFGVSDLKFSFHPNDSARARKMLVGAIEAGASFEDIIDEAEKFLASKSSRQEHIDKQLERMKLLESWF